MGRLLFLLHLCEIYVKMQKLCNSEFAIEKLDQVTVFNSKIALPIEHIQRMR